MANNKYFYRTEAWFGDNSAVFGNKNKNAKDCVNELNHFINLYTSNNLIKIGIIKREVGSEKEFICPQSN